MEVILASLTPQPHSGSKAIPEEINPKIETRNMRQQKQIETNEKSRTLKVSVIQDPI
jgi:hypothetical protein